MFTMACNWTSLIIWLAALGVPTFAANPLDIIKPRIPKVKLQIDKIENCVEFPNADTRLDNVIAKESGFNQFLINGKVNFSRAIDKPLSVSLEMFKCSSKIHPDSCAYFLSMKKDGVCGFLQNSKMSFWENFSKNTDFPKTCPFPAKVYHMNDAPLDFKNVQFLPFYQPHWRAKTTYYQNEKLVSCIVFDGTMSIVNGA